MKHLAAALLLVFSLIPLALAQDSSYLSANGSKAADTGGKSRLLHYSPEAMPIPVYVPTPGTDEGAAQTIKKAFEAWQQAAPDTVSFTFVDGPGEGVLEVHWQALPTGQVGTYHYVYHVDASGRYIYHATDITLDPSLDEGTLYRYALLEVGHALGLFGRSPYAGDAMSASPSGTVSARDAQTLKELYAVPSGTVLQ